MNALDFFLYTAAIVLVVFIIGRVILLVVLISLIRRIVATMERVGETTNLIEKKIHSTYAGILEGVLSLVHFFLKKRR